MAYTKTNWVNGEAPPLNATNLNKIEQGIEDAHGLAGGEFVTVGSGGDYATMYEAQIAGERNIKVLAGNHTWSCPAPVLYDPKVDSTPITIIGEGEGSTFLKTDWADSGTDGMLVLDNTNQVTGDVANSFIIQNNKELLRDGGSWIDDGFYKGMPIDCNHYSQSPLVVAELTPTSMYLDAVPEHITAGTCNKIREFVSIELHIRDITIEFPTNWDWITHYTGASNNYSGTFNHIFSNMTMISTENTGNKTPWNDGHGYPKRFDRVNFIDAQSGSDTFRTYLSPGTILDSCTCGLGVWPSGYGQITFTGCKFPEDNQYLNDENSILIGCHFEYDMLSSNTWGTLGEQDVPVILGCTDNVNGNLVQPTKVYGMYFPSGTITIPELGGLDARFLCSTSTINAPSIERGNWVNGQKFEFVLNGTSLVIDFVDNIVRQYDNATTFSTITLTKGTSGLATVSLMWSSNVIHVLDYNHGGDGSMVFS